jgi:7 transmembrane receptor (rhodopsin family)
MVPVCLMQANSLWPTVYFIMTISVFFLLPLCVLMALYTVIARHLMADPAASGCKSGGAPGGTLSSTSGQQQAGESNNLRARRQVVLMLGTVVLSFFICLMPFRVFTLWIIVVPEEMVMKLGVEGYYNLLYFCRTMLYLNSAVNPILYNLMSSKFRLGFTRLCGLRRRRRGRWRRGSELRRLQGSAGDLTTVQRGDAAANRVSGTVFTRNGTLTSLSYSSFYHSNRTNSTRLPSTPEHARENNNGSPKSPQNGRADALRKSLIVRNPSTSLEPASAANSGSAAMLTRFTVRQSSFDAQPESFV